MKNPRRESADTEVSGGEVVRGDAAPVEQDENFGADEAIRARAYELYLKRGDGSAGDEMNDWLEAEREYHERRGESGGAEARDQPGS
jgi:hypothetical protein